MKANELRIGNLVMDRGNKILQIDWFERSKVCQKMEINKLEVHPLTEDFEYLQPIPLTEEWWLKFGFDLIPFVAPSQSCGVDLYHGYNYAVLKIGYKTELILRYKSDFSKIRIEGFYSSELKYVHQLQNLYFALTGEELTIKN